MIAQRQTIQGPDHGSRQAGAQALAVGEGLVAQLLGGRRQGGRIPGIATGNGGGAVQDAGALLQHERDVDARGNLDAGIVGPCGVGVGPALDPQTPIAGGVGGQAGLVTVQAGQDLNHARAGPVGAVGAHEDGGGAEAIMALSEDGGPDRDHLAGYGLGRPAPVLDDGEDLGHWNTADRRVRSRLRSGCVGGWGRGLRRGVARGVRGHRPSLRAPARCVIFRRACPSAEISCIPS